MQDIGFELSIDPLSRQRSGSVEWAIDPLLFHRPEWRDFKIPIADTDPAVYKDTV